MAPERRPNPNDWDMYYVRNTSVEELVRDAIEWDKALRELTLVSARLWFSMTWPNPEGPGHLSLRVQGHGMLNTQARLVLRVAKNIWGDKERLKRALKAVKKQYLHMVPDTDGYDPARDDAPRYDNDFDEDHDEYDSSTPHSDARLPDAAWT